MTLATDEPGPLRPRSWGRYLLGRRIGAGGMGAVFAALQRGPAGVSRLVAVKIMATPLAGDSEYRRLFLREAAISTRLEHPNVVRTYDVGEVDGELYLALEFIHGVPLSRALGAGHLPPVARAVALRVVADVAAALQAAHELRDARGLTFGLVHQDVSPQNILVGRDGLARLLDFGIARLDALDATASGRLRGKPPYMAPEQLVGGTVDGRTDLFSLALVLHELLAGAPVFTATALLDPGERARRVEAAIDSLRPELPAPLGAVLERALRPSPDQRFPTVAAFRQALLAASEEAGCPLAAPPQLAAWVLDVAPDLPPPQALERELEEALLPTPASVADLVTLRPGQPPSPPSASSPALAPPPTVSPPSSPSPPTSPPARRGARSWFAVLLGLGVGAGLTFALLSARTTPVPVPAPAAVSGPDPRPPPPVVVASVASAPASDTSPARPPPSSRAAPGPGRAPGATTRATVSAAPAPSAPSPTYDPFGHQ